MTRKQKWALAGALAGVFLLGAAAGTLGTISIIVWASARAFRSATGDGGSAGRTLPQQMQDDKRLMAAQEQLRRLAEQMKVYSNSDEPDWMMPPGNQESQARELERVLGELLGESQPEPAKPEAGKPRPPETEPRKQER